MESHNASRPWRYQPFITSSNGCANPGNILRLTAVPYLFTCPQPDTASVEPSRPNDLVSTTDSSICCEDAMVISNDQRQFKNSENRRQKDRLIKKVNSSKSGAAKDEGLSLLNLLKEDWLSSAGSERQDELSTAQGTGDGQHPTMKSRRTNACPTVQHITDNELMKSLHEKKTSESSQGKDELFTVKWHTKTRVINQNRLTVRDLTEQDKLTRPQLSSSQQKKQKVPNVHEDLWNKSTSISEDEGLLVGEEEVDNITSDDPDLDDPDDPDPLLMTDEETFSTISREETDAPSQDMALSVPVKWMPEEIQTFVNRSNKLRIAHRTARSVLVVNPAFYVDEEKKHMDFDGDKILRPVFIFIDKLNVKMIVHSKVFEEADIKDIPASIDILKKVENKFIQNQYIFCPGVSETYIKAFRAVGIKVPLKTIDKYSYCGKVSYHDKFCEKFYRKSNSVSMSKVHGFAYTCRCCNHKIYYYRARYRSKKLGVIQLKVRKSHPSSNLRKVVFAKYSQNTSLSGHLRRRQRDIDIMKLSENMKAKSFTLNSKQNKDFIEVLETLKNDAAVHEIFKRDTQEAVNARRWAAFIVWDGDVKKASYLRCQLLSNGAHDSHSSETAKHTHKRYKREASNRWSVVTFRIALAIYMRNKESYELMEPFRVLELPLLPPLNEYNVEVENTPVSHLKYIAEQAKQYFALSEEYKADGQPPCLGEGILIIDQMKVISNVVWYGIHESLVGHNLSQEELLNLSDIFNKSTDVKTPRPDEYVLQTLWRDMCYDHDIIGPYFHLSHNVKGQQLANYLLWTIKSFNDFGLKTLAIVCDTATVNGVCFRGSLGERGPLWDGSDDTYEINPTFTNPFDPSLKISWIVCPNHMLINVINALHSSQPEGSKDFKYGGISFGWKPLEFLLENDMERVEKNEPRIAPLLRKSYIERRHTIKFQYALFPSKILQKTEVMEALEKESRQTTNEDIKPMMQKTLEFLTATNKIFEKGLLSNIGITAKDEDLITNIMEGYHWFCDWLKEAHTADFQIRNPRQKEFLSWQTWEGLRLLVHGFKSLCKSFHSRHPDRAIVPIRLNGSAIEIIFSQVRHRCGTGKGKTKVSALSYPVGLTDAKFNRQLRRKRKRNEVVKSSSKKLKES